MISPIRPETACLHQPSSKMQIKADGTHGGLSDQGSDVNHPLQGMWATRLNMMHGVQCRAVGRQDFQGKQHKEGVTVA